MTAAIAAMQGTLASLKPGSAAPLPPSVSFAELQTIVGFPKYWEQEKLYQT
jgi:hypothetical protein